MLRSLVDLYAPAAGRDDDGLLHDALAERPRSPSLDLTEQQEATVAAVAEALLTIAMRIWRAVETDVSEARVLAAVGGAEWAVRIELLEGREDDLPAFLPGLAFLVTLPLLGEPEAMVYLDRAEKLVAEG